MTGKAGQDVPLMGSEGSSDVGSRQGHEDMQPGQARYARSGLSPDPGSPAGPRIGQEGRHLCAHVLPPPLQPVCPLSKQALCGGGQRRFPLCRRKRDSWAFKISRTFQHFDPSYIFGSHGLGSHRNIPSLDSAICPFTLTSCEVCQSVFPNV